MDLRERIRRRQRTGEDSQVVLDYDAISPVAHMAGPTGRGPVVERLLDYLEPVFDGGLPPDAYLWGDGGAGKSAVVTALFSHLSRLLSDGAPVVHTTTRAQSTESPTFVYVDSRRADSTFGLYRDVLESVSGESVPRHGIGTDTLRNRLADRLAGTGSAVVAVDHVEEPGTLQLDGVAEAFDGLADSVTWLTVGKTALDRLQTRAPPPEHIRVPPYEDHALVDILTSRASDGLARGAIRHEQVRRLAAWADGDAHDALAGLFGAADVAAAEEHGRIYERDLERGMEAVPRPSVATGRVLTLPENRQRVLRRLVDLDPASLHSVSATAETITAEGGIDLSAATVKRFLYELAEDGITERVQNPTSWNGVGRPPSRVEPLFPTLVFRRLYDLRSE
jgi:Cdc6-like AAA superfamily ATPase